MGAWNPRPGVLSNLMWIMDRVLKFTNFGIVSVLHEDFFIQAGRDKRDASLEELRRHIVNSYIPLGRQFMVLFPEGGFLHKRREISQRFADKNNLPKLEYVTLPRAGAMKIIMEEIGPQREYSPGTSQNENSKRENHTTRNVPRAVAATSPHLEWVLDVTIAYPDRVPLHLIQDVVCGIRPPCSIRLHYRLYPITEVPPDSEGMTQWLYDRFIEKDRMLEEYYRTGQFPTTSDTQVVRQVRQDNLRFLIVHAFFIASTYVQYQLFYAVWSWIW
ncbi:acyl-CoA:lysophosphatidylglycerol acyltransferase 1-like isoform X1 [Cydia fagiglandana]|uniref:acyl-CoA:lysophosphatidylglycerol acyltransferase 1-like isoform X1 n=1 Tax=Cydia fagiglandana TaxID=1458189 RepID=UPI002FEE5AD9